LAIGAIVLGILGLLTLPVLLFVGFVARRPGPPSVMVSSTPSAVVIAPLAPAPTVAAPATREAQALSAYLALQQQVKGVLSGNSAAQIKATENFIDEYEDTSYAHSAWATFLLPLKPDAPAPGDTAVAALIKSAKEKIVNGDRQGAADDYQRAAELTEDSARAMRYNMHAYQLRKFTTPSNQDTSDIVVPPEILKQAELGDHFETIDGEMKNVGKDSTTSPELQDKNTKH
jgi:hypothetical protein